MCVCVWLCAYIRIYAVRLGEGGGVSLFRRRCFNYKFRSSGGWDRDGRGHKDFHENKGVFMLYSVYMFICSIVEFLFCILEKEENRN